jgi:hypothetical protein
LTIESAAPYVEPAPVRVNRVRTGVRRAQFTTAQAVLLVAALVGFTLLQGLVRRLLGQVDSARSHTRGRIDTFFND